LFKSVSPVVLVSLISILLLTEPSALRNIIWMVPFSELPPAFAPTTIAMTEFPSPTTSPRLATDAPN